MEARPSRDHSFANKLTHRFEMSTLRMAPPDSRSARAQIEFLLMLPQRATETADSGLVGAPLLLARDMLAKPLRSDAT
jgi:hypothetical protein